jgi:N-acetylmuramoyl-L-alanine amidase
MRLYPLIALLNLVTVRSAAEPLRVVIDPGHGGSNLGAAGAVEGTLEKRLTLALARLVRDEILRERPDADVRLTREDDRFVTLSQRTRIANDMGATAFVSLHMNASPDRGQRGFETYVHGAGPVVEPGESQARGPVDEILADLRREAMLAESAHLAAIVQRHLGDVLGPARDRGVKRAPFDVLHEARAPAVLVEVGFLDNAEEGPRLLDGRVQRDIARALADAIVEFGARREARRLVLYAQP